jgi:molybdopterin molybdotransferase
MIAALLHDLGLPVSELAHSRDTLPETTSTLQRLANTNDIILLSGGVSVGDKDHVKPALTALGMPPEIWRIRVKPGKPFLFTHRPGPDPAPLFVFGLPGNPVSAFVTFHLFVRPALLQWTGAEASELEPTQTSALLAQKLSNPGDRPHYVRGLLQNGQFRVGGLQRSDALFALSQANALLRLEPEESLDTGSPVIVWKV